MENSQLKPEGKPDNIRHSAFKGHLWENMFTETLKHKLDSNLL